MRALRRTWKRLVASFSESAGEDELVREIESHLEMQVQDNLRLGMSPNEARRAAVLKFGGIEPAKESYRDQRGMPWLANVTRDFRYGLRELRRGPGFALTIVLLLALGIGANTAIFSLTNQILLSVLPVKEPHKLVLLNWRGQFIGGSAHGWKDTFSYPAYIELRDANQVVFSGIAARFESPVDVSDNGFAERANAELVSGNYFDVLGVTAALGRTLTPGEDKIKDGEPYVVLSYEYWQRRFGGSHDVLNRVIDVNGYPMTVIGIAQKGYGGVDMLSPSDVYIPMQMKLVVTPSWDDRLRRDSIWLKIVARLAPGVDERTAQRAIDNPYLSVLENDLAAHPHKRDFAEAYRKNHIQLAEASKGLGTLHKLLEKPLYVLIAMVGTLLLITCVNVANLLIARAASRQREIAIRLSLGATRGSLVRLMMTESVILAGLGGTLGLLFSSWIASFLLHMLPFKNIDAAIRTGPDPTVLAITGALSLLTAVIFGLVPALQSSRPNLAPTLKDASVSISLGGGQAKLRRCLVSVQVALSLLLLVGAGLFTRSLHRLLAVDSGIQITKLLTFSIDPSMHKYTPERSRRLFLDCLDRLSHLPGAVSASASSSALLSQDTWQNSYVVEGYHPAAEEDMTAAWNQVLPGFFSTIGVSLIAGREFTEKDSTGAPPVAIVNEAFVKRFFPGQNPLGRHIGYRKPDIEVVGVVRDSKGGDLKEKPREWTYTPVFQDKKPSQVTFYVRSMAPPAGLAPAVRQTMNRLDAALPVLDMKTLETQVNETHFLDRLFALLSGVFGFLATLLASIGLYGVTASSVGRRTQEIGIRMALGARQGSVLGLILKEVLLLAAIGIVIGIPVALALGRLVESQLYGMRASDPGVLTAGVATIAAVSLLAGYIPALRAARIDPIRALRSE